MSAARHRIRHKRAITDSQRQKVETALAHFREFLPHQVGLGDLFKEAQRARLSTEWASCLELAFTHEQITYRYHGRAMKTGEGIFYAFSFSALSVKTGDYLDFGQSPYCFYDLIDGPAKETQQ